MNQSIRVFACLLVLIFIILPISVFAYSGPDDPDATKAAGASLKRLGPDRGAISISGEILSVIGLKGVGYAGEAAEINKDLAELGAEKVGTEVKVLLSGDVLFDFDRWEIKKEAEETLRKLAKGIKELGWKHVLIEGHTDSKGSEEYNLRLSEKRAKAVKQWFIEEGGLVDLEFKTRGYGESRPVAPNENPDGSDNPEGRAKNRRVEIRISRY
jgi:outer membrane protein OmpA-like peptidoglycan-associated protein